MQMLVCGYSCREGYSDNEKKTLYSIMVAYCLTVFEGSNTRDDAKRTGNHFRGAGCVAVSELGVSSKFARDFELEFLNKFNGNPVLMDLQTTIRSNGSNIITGFTGSMSPIDKMFSEFGGNNKPAIVPQSALKDVVDFESLVNDPKKPNFDPNKLKTASA